VKVATGRRKGGLGFPIPTDITYRRSESRPLGPDLIRIAILTSICLNGNAIGVVAKLKIKALIVGACELKLIVDVEPVLADFVTLPNLRRDARVSRHGTSGETKFRAKELNLGVLLVDVPNLSGSAVAPVNLNRRPIFKTLRLEHRGRNWDHHRGE